MEETVNQVPTTAEEPERTFAQSEMDAIIRDRLKRERDKYADYETIREKAEKYDAAEEASKTELQKANERADALQKQLDTLSKADGIRQIRDKVSKETGVPAALLSGEDEDSCKAQAQAILEFAKPQTYPSVRDGGEVVKPGAGATTSQQFAEWFNESLKN